MSSPNVPPSDHAHSVSKRRKLRKGTHSCWECKRRKMKCIFDPLANTAVCNGCRRRGGHCISQEFPEDVSLAAHVDRAHRMGDGISADRPLHAGNDGSTSDGRTPTTTTRNEVGRAVDNGIQTPVSIRSESTRHLPFFEIHEVRESDFDLVRDITDCSHKRFTFENDDPQSAAHAPASQRKLEKLSRFLYESLPSREDTERICNAGRHPSVLAHEIMTMPYTTLNQNGLKTAASLLEIPGPNLHPVLISRHMLVLASFLQHLHPDLHKEIEGLSQSPRIIMERLAGLAINLVTTNDELLGSIEGLECVMIESVYQANIGNLRRSWIAGRRAMAIAQLMGLNRSDDQTQYKVLDPKTKYHPRLMWFRIVFLDRYLCLMLGVSQGSLDRSMASDVMLANDTPLGRLERIHCVVASRILEHKESNPGSHDLALTRTLDEELQRAARSLPSKWWLAPSLDSAPADAQALFWNTRRIFAQVFHYNLLNQLHLPYMLQSSSSAAGDRNTLAYSRITCANASREVLSRFIALRSFNAMAYSCRTVDFLALMAAMTLLLAHLDSLQSGAENFLAHQYHSDRAMIEQVQENMEEVNRLNSDALSAQSADLLRRLLAIDVQAADGDRGCSRRVSVKKGEIGSATPDQDDNVVVSINIPYFGIVRITCEDMSKEATATTSHLAQSQVAPSGLSPIETMTPVDSGYNHVEAPPIISDDAYAKAQAEVGTSPTAGANDDAMQSALQHQSDLLLRNGEFPGLAAGAEDWAFQGVDMAFFESLMGTDS